MPLPTEPREKGEAMFRSIAQRLESESELVSVGRMLSSPGIKYGDKVFAFYYKGEMVFRLGKHFDPSSLGVKRYVPLNPFKTRPPVAGWYQVPSSEGKKWEELARHALRIISEGG
jgi:hypothetical protein